MFVRCRAWLAATAGTDTKLSCLAARWHFCSIPADGCVSSRLTLHLCALLPCTAIWLLKIFYFVRLSFLMCLYIWTPRVCLVPAVVREDPGSSESVVTDGCELTCLCCKLSPGPRPVFLTSKESPARHMSPDCSCSFCAPFGESLPEL